MPTVCFDYCFLRDKPGGESVPVLVGRERKTRMVLAHVVPFKGSGVDWLVAQLLRDLRKFGLHGKVILKSDQENAVLDVLNSVCKARGKEGGGSSITLVEASPKGESQSNGVAERAVQDIEEGARAHKLDLESKVGKPIPVTHNILSWMVENVSDVINKQMVGSDGKTAFERLKGKKYKGEFLEFGSNIFHRVPEKPQGGLMTQRCMPGARLGKRFTTDEHVIGMDDGRVVRSRCVRTRPEEDSWNIDSIDKVKGQPWDPSMTLTYAKLAEERCPAMSIPTPAEEELVPKPRAPRISLADLEKAGWAAGCAKCRAMRDGDDSKVNLGHSAKCKARIQEILADDPDYKKKAEQAEARKNRYCEDIHRVMEAKGPEGSVSSGLNQPQSAPSQQQEEATGAADAMQDDDLDIPIATKRARDDQGEPEPPTKRVDQSGGSSETSEAGRKRGREDDDQSDEERGKQVDAEGDDVMGYIFHSEQKVPIDEKYQNLLGRISAKGGASMMWPKSFRPREPRHEHGHESSEEDGA